MQKLADYSYSRLFTLHRHTSYLLLIYPSIRLLVSRDILVILYKHVHDCTGILSASRKSYGLNLQPFINATHLYLHGGTVSTNMSEHVGCTACICSHFASTFFCKLNLSSRSTLAVSQYQVRKVRTCVLGSSDFARTGGHKSGNSANGTAVYLITSISLPKLSTLYYNTTKYDIKHHCLFLFSCKHINSRKNVFQGTYSENIFIM